MSASLRTSRCAGTYALAPPVAVNWRNIVPLGGHSGNLHRWILRPRRLLPQLTIEARSAESDHVVVAWSPWPAASARLAFSLSFSSECGDAPSEVRNQPFPSFTATLLDGPESSAVPDGCAATMDRF